MSRPSAPHRSSALIVGALTVGSVLLVVGGTALSRCEPETTVEHPAKPRSGEAAAGVDAAEVPEIDLRDDAYSQSGACAECHADEHASWSRSFHRTMTTRASASTIKGDFDAGFLDAAQRYSVGRDRDGFYATAVDPAGRVDRRAVVLVTGSHHMQVYWLEPEPGMPLQSFAYAYLLPERRWVLNDATLLRPPLPSGQPPTVFTWNRVCIKCHAVDGVPGLDAQTAAVRTTVAELGIACESCHGPAAKHVAAHRRFRQTGDAVTDEAGLVDPSAITAKQGSEVCAQCHSITIFKDEDAWLAAGRSHGPASGLSPWATLVQHPLIGDGPWLDTLLAEDESFIADRFWPDGGVRVSGREYNGIVESACAASEDFGCTTCHDMHGETSVDGGPWNDDQLRPGEREGASCRGCHAEIAADVSAHSHHPPGEGSNCINCHMPRTTYGLLKAMPSHRITSPSVEGSRRFGRPNACNLCHLDRTLGWTERTLAEWSGQASAGHDGGDTKESEVAIGLQWMLSGDAGQRALLAWHAGFAPSQRASGVAWLEPALVRLLRDDYLVVRIIAERSLETLERSAGPAGAVAAARPEVGLLEDAQVDHELLDRLWADRDLRRISLAE